MKNFVFAIIFSIFLTGCAAAPGLIFSPIIDGYIRWVEGEAHKYYEYPQNILKTAVSEAASELNFKLISEEEKNKYYYMVFGENNRFKVKIVPTEPNITKVSIRVNTMGDKDYAELFYSKIDEKIKHIRYTQ